MISILLASEGAAHEAPSIFLSLWKWTKTNYPGLAQWFGFTDEKLGQSWFDAIGFSILSATVVIVLSILATRRYERVPRGIQNLMEWAVGMLRSFVHGIIGEKGDKYLPYLGTTFLFIFIMNLLGIIPAFRSPTMTLSTTAALGITTFVMVQGYGIRANGLWGYVRHFMGPVIALAPLMFVVEVISEFARPLSLSLRLYGNIFGEDTIIEQLMTLGGWVPIQLPMLAFAIFTSFLQAFIFTCLSSVYIALKVVHDEEHGEKHEEPYAHAAHS